MNKILQGDNINSLHYLIDTDEKFEVIYIDPPYNSNLKDLGYKDIFTKNGWFDFMKARLKLAKDLLTDDGIIFISIDERSFGDLKIICDNVFKYNIQTFIWKCRGGANDGKYNTSTNHEYILCYGKTKQATRLRGVVKEFEKYQNPDNDKNGPWIKDSGTAASGTDDYIYPIINPYTKEEYYPPTGRYWAFPKYRVDEWVKDNKMVFSKTPGEGLLIKRYQNQIKHNEYTVSSTVLVENEKFFTLHGTKELKKIFPEGCKFKYPKPVGLISYLVNLHHNTNARVLDFFAGSGTTGQAVDELNKIDKGKRNFVLCTNNENNICKEVTCERLNRLKIEYSLIVFDESIDEKYIEKEPDYDEMLLNILEKDISNEKKVKKIKEITNKKLKRI